MSTLVARFRRFVHCLFRTFNFKNPHCAVTLRSPRGVRLTCTCGKTFHP
jgi:hypothetical protein